MKIFEQHFQPEIVVTVMTNSQGTVVRAFTRRPDPTWLRKGVESKSRPTPRLTDDEVKESLLRLVKTLPGRTRSFYCQRPKSRGGCLGSQARKEDLLAELIASNTLRQEQLPSPVGRATHAIYVND